MGIFGRKPDPALPEFGLESEPVDLEPIVADGATMVKKSVPISHFQMIKPDLGRSSSSLKTITERRIPKHAENWHNDAWKFYEEIPEIAYTMNVTAQTLSSGDIRLERFNDEDPKCGWEHNADPEALNVREALYGPHGGIKELMRKAALQMQIAGDSYLLGIPVIADDGLPLENQYLWEFVSADQIEINRSSGGKETVKRKNRHCGDYEELPEGTYAARLHRSHPRFTDDSDSNMRHIMPVAEELHFLTQLQKAVIKSRLHAGVLYVPSELLMGPDDEHHADDELKTDNIDPFFINILDYFINAIEDPCSIEAVAPLIVSGPAQFENNFQLKPLERQLNQEFVGIRKDLIGRIGAGLDIPAEILDGKHGLNQATGWQVSGEFLSRHVIPLGERIADFLTESYLRPMLMLCEGLTKEEACKYRLSYDVSNIAVRQDQATVALRLYREGEISGKALREQSGLCEDDAPTLEDYDDPNNKMKLYLDLIRVAPVELGKILLPVIAELLGDESLADAASRLLLIEAEGGELPSGVDPSDQDIDRVRPGGETRESEGNPSATPSIDDPSDRPGRRARGEDTSASVVDRISVAADAAFDQVFEKAGSKYISKAPRKATQGFMNTRKRNIFSKLAPSDIEALDLDIGFFFDSYDALGEKVEPWVLEWLTSVHGLEGFAANDEASDITKNLLKALDEFTKENIFNTHKRFGDSQLKIPVELVVDALGSTSRFVI